MKNFFDVHVVEELSEDNSQQFFKITCKKSIDDGGQVNSLRESLSSIFSVRAVKNDLSAKDLHFEVTFNAITKSTNTQKIKNIIYEKFNCEATNSKLRTFLWTNYLNNKYCLSTENEI